MISCGLSLCFRQAVAAVVVAALFYDVSYRIMCIINMIITMSMLLLLLLLSLHLL